MNNPSQAIRRFNRFELKYLLTLKRAETLKRALSFYLVPDNNGGGDGRYTLSSLYYDSPGFRCFQENLDGIRFRRKLRIGRYQLPVGGDVITAVDGQPTADLEALTVYLETETSIGDTVELTVMRDGTEITIPLTLGKEPQA